jgi:hypothetical protein
VYSSKGLHLDHNTQSRECQELSSFAAVGVIFMAQLHWTGYPLLVFGVTLGHCTSVVGWWSYFHNVDPIQHSWSQSPYFSGTAFAGPGGPAGIFFALFSCNFYIGSVVLVLSEVTDLIYHNSLALFSDIFVIHTDGQGNFNLLSVHALVWKKNTLWVHSYMSVYCSFPIGGRQHACLGPLLCNSGVRSYWCKNALMCISDFGSH